MRQPLFAIVFVIGLTGAAPQPESAQIAKACGATLIEVLAAKQRVETFSKDAVVPINDRCGYAIRGGKISLYSIERPKRPSR